MVFPVVGGDGKPTGYEIENSIRLNSADSAYLKKTVGDGNRRKWTLSMWLKKTKIINNTEMYMWSSDDTGSGNAHDGAGFYSFGSVTGDNASNSFHHQLGDAHGRIVASANARDVSAWYHVVWNVDTANSTAGDRMKLFVNGSRITDVVTSNNNPNQNFDTEFNRNSTENYLFADHHYGRYYFDGYVADVAFVDGQAYDASYFGETNDNGVWVPIEPNVSSWGTNGFFLEFKQTGTSANSSGIGADTSGNDNHWTPVNLAATDVTVDTPTNNFATMNPLGGITGTGGGTFSEGNCKYVTSGTDSTGALSTIPVGTGKWYAEFKAISKTGNYYNYGVANTPTGIFSGSSGFISIVYRSDGKIYKNGNEEESSLTSISDNNIVGMAYDGDNNRIQFYINGSSAGSVTTISDTTVDVFFTSASNGGTTQTTEINFGNAPFSISSSNSDANGYGSFEYAVPSGYYALCTKNLAEYG